jgi:hypothetical protein
MRQTSSFVRQISMVTGKTHIGWRSPFSPYCDHNSGLLSDQSVAGPCQHDDGMPENRQNAACLISEGL